MKTRPGITLVEVLVSIFIMGIGMIALLTLFPLGAINVAQALRDDRAALAAANADGFATARDLRHDAAIADGFVQELAGLDPAYLAVGPSSPLFVDPFRTQLGDTRLGAAGTPNTTGIRRVSPAYVNDTPVPDDGSTPTTRATYFFSLLDDLNFDPDGTATRDASNAVQRGGRYTWAYLLRRARAGSDALVEMSVVVYANRPASVGADETTYAAIGTVGQSTLTIDYGGQNLGKPRLRPGGWILDTTRDPTGVVRGYFYRVVAVQEDAGSSLVLELAQPVRAGLNVDSATAPGTFAVVAMENVIEVFDRGTGRRP